MIPKLLIDAAGLILPTGQTVPKGRKENIVYLGKKHRLTSLDVWEK